MQAVPGDARRSYLVAWCDAGRMGDGLHGCLPPCAGEHHFGRGGGLMRMRESYYYPLTLAKRLTQKLSTATMPHDIPN